MHFHLTVAQPFGKYERGAHISDQAEAAEILAGPHKHNVVQRIASAEHVSGDFYRTDAEIAARDAKVKAALSAPSQPAVKG